MKGCSGMLYYSNKEYRRAQQKYNKLCNERLINNMIKSMKEPFVPKIEFSVTSLDEVKDKEGGFGRFYFYDEKLKD